MQLVRLQVHGFRRFLDADAHLHGRLIVLVGPNEAGKSSLLDALVALNSSDAIAPADISHDHEYPADHSVLWARFWLEDSDRAAIEDLPGGADVRWFIVAKRQGGTLATGIEPSLSVDPRPRKAARELLRRVLRTKWAAALSRTTADELGSQIDALEAILDANGPYDDTHRASMTTASDGLASAAGAPKLASRLSSLLADLVESEPTESPNDVARRRLLERRPLFLKFSQEHRDLQSLYELNGMDLDNPPAALENVARLGGLDLRRILLAVQAGDYASPERPIEEANVELARFFRESWTQSGIAVRLSHHETRLHVLISTPVGPYTSIRERSDGLREFVALATFAEVHGGGGRDIVLLIDEAETHLHYNAQADLVRVLDLQEAASAVIYTTHSAGCLPEDLGSTVRVVVRVDDLWSEVQNAFWTKGTGFDPLLLGMGASALVFGAIRRAVVAEGATDLILLPSLLKEANSLPALGYQIAPGVAEASISAIEDLELQASRTAYVVDDDEGGRRHAAKLRAAGIESARIHVLGDGVEGGFAVEDLVRKDLYLKAINRELEKSGRADRLRLRDVPRKGRSLAVRRWCDARGYSEPKKVNVATTIALDARVDAPILAPIGRRILQDLHRRVGGYLGEARAAQA